MAKSFFKKMQGIMISQFICIPGKVRIEEAQNAFPELV
jgi:hypothetical protein